MIGVNSQIATNGSDANTGVGFAVPVDTVKQVVPQIKADGKIERAYLGVANVHAAGARRRRRRHASRRRGPAAAAPACSAGDKIVEIDGKPIDSPRTSRQPLLSTQAGGTVQVKVVRGGDRRTIDGGAR